MSFEVTDKAYENLRRQGFIALRKVIPNLKKYLHNNLKTMNYRTDEFELDYKLLNADNNEIRLTLHNSDGIQPAIEFEIEVNVEGRTIMAFQRRWNEYARLEYSSEEEFDSKDPEQDALYYFMTASLISWLKSLVDHKIFSLEDRNVKIWTEEAVKHLKGRTITEVRYLYEDEQESLRWDSRCVVVHFDDGSLMFPSRDEMGNDAATLLGQTPDGEDFTLPVI